MIVDVHTRIWEPHEPFGQLIVAGRSRRQAVPWERPNASQASHQGAMQPVSKAIIVGFESAMLDVQITADAVAEYVAADPDRYLGFAGIDPTVGSLTGKLDHAQQLGLVGVAVSPAAQGFHPADTRAMKLYEQCQQRGLPVVFESGSLLSRQARMEFGQPHLLDEVARSFVDLKMILTSLGDPWIEQSLTLVAKHPTVFANLSSTIGRPWQLYNALLRAYQRGVIEQLVFASNFPFMTPEQAIVAIYSVNTLIQGTHLPSVPREQLRSIVERDALACLGLVSEKDQGPTRDVVTDQSTAGARATAIKDSAGDG